MRHRNKRASPKTPAYVWIFVVMRGEILAVFFTEFFWRLFPFSWCFFQSSICLSFFGRGFLEMNSGSGLRGLVGKLSPRKMPVFSPKNPAVKSSLHLRF